MYASSTSAVVLGLLARNKVKIGSKRVAILYAYIVLTFLQLTAAMAPGNISSSVNAKEAGKQVMEESKWKERGGVEKRRARNECCIKVPLVESSSSALKCHLTASCSIRLLL